jgi:hypothetical protein
MNKEVMKRNAKSDKLWKAEKSDVEHLEDSLLELKQISENLKSEIFTEEGTYLSVAKDKKEKKLKSGKNEKYINTCQNIVDSSKAKIESTKKDCQARIDKWEAEKKAFLIDINAKIEKAEATILSTEKTCEQTIIYHQGVIDDSYEEIPLVVTFPPSHHKKKEQLREILSSIETMNKNILAIKAAEYDQSSKTSEYDLRMRKLREESDRADAETLRLARKQQEEEELQAALERKRIFEADKQRAKQRAIEREKEKEMGIIVERPFDPHN